MAGRNAAALGGLAVLLGVTVWIGTARRAPQVAAARFAGAVGQLDDDNGFLNFIRKNFDKTVNLDVTIGNDAFEGGDESEFSFFVVFDECHGLAENEKPKALNCSGCEFNIPRKAGAPSVFVREGNLRRLRGRFHVIDGGGPLQGMFTVKLYPS